MREIEKKTAEEFETINKPNEILYLIMTEIVKKNKYNMMEICLNCLKELLSNQSEIFSYEDDIAFINLLNKIEEENEVLNEVKKMFITHQSKTSHKEKSNQINSDEVRIKELLDDTKKQSNKMNICYSFRKLISFLSISAGSNSYINISLECLDDIFSFIKPYIIKTKDDSFYSSIIIKVFVTVNIHNAVLNPIDGIYLDSIANYTVIANDNILRNIAIGVIQEIIYGIPR